MSKLSEFNQHLRELADSPISKIGIAAANGIYIHFTEFDDSDLIELWKNYLPTVKLKKYRETIFTKFKQRKLLGGIHYRVSFTIENTAEPYYLFFFRDRVSRLNDDNEYRIISSGERPHNITYKESVRRHGRKTIDTYKIDVSWSNLDEFISKVGENDQN